MLAALHVVGVEQRILGVSGHHRGKLPTQIRRVPDTAVVALSLPHRHQVGGVACEQEPTAAKRPGDPRMMGVNPVPDHVDSVGMRDEVGEHAREKGRILCLLVGLVGVNHELEAANSVRDRDRGVGALRVGADLAVGMSERIVGDVDDQPARR